VPLYEYKCNKCGKRSERIEKMNGPYLKKCPHCGGSVEQLMSAPAIQFKGSGWYVTDYGKSSSGGGSDKSENSGNSEKGATKPAEKSGDKGTEKSAEKKSEGSKKNAAKGK